MCLSNQNAIERIIFEIDALSPTHRIVIIHFFFLCGNVGVYSTTIGLATRGIFFLLLIAIVLHILDRQGDYVARTDFLWKAKLKTEQEEVETMRGINKVQNLI